MKKYLIINDNGDKKTVYAKDLMQALKLSDAINIIPGMFITLKADPLHSVYRVKEINHGKYGVVLVRYSMWDGQLVERDAGGNYSFDSLKKNVTNIFNTYDEAKKYLLHHDAVRTAPLRKKNDSVDAAAIDKPIDTVDEAYNPEYSIQQFKSYVSNIIKDLYGNDYNRETVRAISKLNTYASQVIDDFKADIKNSNLDKRKTVQYYTQYVDALYEEITNVKNIQNIDGQSLKKIDDIHAKMAHSIHDSVKDSKVRDIDASSLMTLFSKYGKPYGYACKTKPRMSSSASKYLGQLVSYTLSPIGKYDMNKAIDFVDFLNRKGYEATIFAPDIIVTLKQDRSSGLYHRGHERTSQYDSIHDEASLATSINALVTDEKAAIDAYDVAIKNLEGKIDDTARQVLINIRDDERRHIENLYAILNDQVTEKNLEDSIHDAAPGVDKKKFDRLVSYFNAWGKPSRNELQEVIDYYKLNSATAYQLLYYWGYKNEFEKLHFYDSHIRDTFEVLWYTDEELNNYETKEFRSRAAAMDFYNAHKNDKDKFAWWVTRRNSDWAVVEDIVY